MRAKYVVIGVLVTEPATGPGSTGHTLDEVMDLAMAVGNPDPPCFDNTDRYVDCGNGTVHDQVTNLIWLKNADCFGLLSYAAANNAAAGLEDGECGLTDGSSPGDWRLPTREEWEATLVRAVSMGCTGPCLTDTPGTRCFSTGQPIFTNVRSNWYWSSSAGDSSEGWAWAPDLLGGGMTSTTRGSSRYVWPVRGGH